MKAYQAKPLRQVFLFQKFFELVYCFRRLIIRQHGSQNENSFVTIHDIIILKWTAKVRKTFKLPSIQWNSLEKS
jgi:hypothetical protein